ncbi:MAG: nucleotidyltransferase [Bacteroidetes bacterium]|nr:MAG: nucleotidyltransferase [Bacteroidota bacterium]
MAKTVNGAFTEFNKESVNLDPERTKKAITSRDWLIGQLKSLPDKVDNFPILYEGMSVKFGSFARKTKIRPLDDIDLILTFRAAGSTYLTHTYGQSYSLTVPESATDLRKLCNDDNTLNSIKVVNKVVSSLDQIEHYKSAATHRRQEAATLQLISYEWNFDIVPAFYTDTGYYLIPDGSGGWKATDPRIDQNRVTTINQKHDGKILQLIRTIKYWNNYAQMPTIPSYLLENFVLNYFDSKDKIDDYIDYNIKHFWYHLKTAIYNSVSDPKGFQTDLNYLTYDEKVKISEKAESTYNKACEAYEAELTEKNQEKAINKWRKIFGDNFPEFE